MKRHDIQQDPWKQAAGEAAAQLVENDMVIGLGTGSTANFLIQALARRIQAGLHIVGAIPSSETSKTLASNLGIPITTLDEHQEIDLCIDGADEIDPQLQLIKGGGGALLREKIVATASRRFVVIADESKLVERLGLHFPVPVEVIPFAATPVRRQLEALGASVQLRQHEGKVFISENHNLIFDCSFPQGISNPAELDAHMQQIVGVVETGLFLHMAQSAIVAGPTGVKTISPPRA
ncbi:ribose-5-phosphate isomerase RpiA [Ktedonosporobacter rubrisoli]|uniref:Ribose-5-phosphate isomerase A n=1 Tax=Ktedonosporobacter rubrisoli TaxID=2509675 RepID=A0A4P6K1G3_KTERU|nr:ribose-5-phosphate isomerase RpiA [Ktedonosporobacter rubrisoli]QBD81835.1 ribose-5-phosphate isomerase RpiA [Ktedonosporobacter rubrisoli]